MKERNMCKFQTLYRSAIVILICSRFPAFATVYQSDGSAASVQGLQNAALNGDTITLPAGTFIWTTGVNITKAITLQGTGVGETIIKDSVQNSNPLIQWTLPNTASASRMTGIEFQDTRTNVVEGVLVVTGSNTSGATFRWDHCKWNGMHHGVPIFDTVIGVVDHNAFVNGSTEVRIKGSFWNNQGQYGDGSWAAPTNFGSSEFLFIEDNTFTNTGGGLSTATDAYEGARFVFRHNTTLGIYVTDHGTESTGRGRGGRAYECYNNNMDGNGLNKFVCNSRSSTVLVHDNTIVNYWGAPEFSLNDLRTIYAFPAFGGADGANPWDVNDPTTYFSGAAASNNSGQRVTVRGANFIPNQWVGYVLRRTSDLCNSGSLNFGEIISNTASTITYTGNGGFATPSMTFCSGDALEIKRVIHSLDMPGRGQGWLVTGNPPALPAGWNNQVTEGCYQWNNGVAQFVPYSNIIKAGVHYFNNAPKPGYIPYTYPHPLVSGASPTPAPTSTPSPSPSPTATATATPISPTPTPTPTATATATATPRRSPRPHPSHAPGP
jgi:hypothetical protein